MRLPRSARMTPCNRFKTRQPKGKQIPPRARPSQARPCQARPARPYPSYTAEPPAFGPTPPLPFCERSHNRFMPFTKPPGSQKGQVSGRREDFCIQTTRVVLGCPIPPGREGYKEGSGRGRGRGCHHVEEKRLRGFPLQRTPIVHLVVSWFVIVQDKWKKRRGKKENEKKKRKEEVNKGNGWCIFSAGCPKL